LPAPFANQVANAKHDWDAPAVIGAARRDLGDEVNAIDQVQTRQILLEGLMREDIGVAGVTRLQKAGAMIGVVKEAGRALEWIGMLQMFQLFGDQVAQDRARQTAGLAGRAGLMRLKRCALQQRPQTLEVDPGKPDVVHQRAKGAGIAALDFAALPARQQKVDAAAIQPGAIFRQFAIIQMHQRRDRQQQGSNPQTTQIRATIQRLTQPTSSPVTLSCWHPHSGRAIPGIDKRAHLSNRPVCQRCRRPTG
jgi:hypothetical protein